MARRFRVHWGNLFVAGLVAAVFVGRLWFGLPYAGVWVAVAAAAIHFFVLPRITAARVRVLDRAMLFAAQRGDTEALDRAVRRAWLVRLYAPRWYLLGRFAWAAAEAGRLEEAERLYEQAASEAKEPDRCRFLANLVSVKRRLGKDKEAASLRRVVVRKRPELADALSGDPPPE